MAEPKRRGRPPKHEDVPVKIPLDFETALRGLMETGTYADEEIEAGVKRAREDKNTGE